MSQPVKFNVNASLFARVAHAQSNEETRYYLNGVCIQPAPEGMPGVTLTATNGHVLVSAYDEQGETNATVIVAAPSNVMKACKPWRDGTEPHLIGDAGALEVMPEKGGAALARDTLVEGSFPDWRRVVPSDIGGATMAVFDSALIAKLAAALAPEKARGLTIRGVSENDPHLVWGTDPRMFGIIMPLRNVGVASPALPVWVHGPPAKAKAA
jgi:DNA polymerase III sliding clamp (beta) subunit (PCNA family)